MGSLSIWHLVLLLMIVVVLFGGGGKLTKIMGDFGKGITAFKGGLKDDETRRLEEGASTNHADALKSETVKT